LTHLARNADGGRHLLTWARTGVPTPEYPSVDARAEAIEIGSGRPTGELVADLREAAARFADACAQMPAGAWDQIVCWTAGKQRPARLAVKARLREVLIHHVDLDVGFTQTQWPEPFVVDMLADVTASLSARSDAPAILMQAVDSGITYAVRTGGGPTVSGPQRELLAWLIGRSSGRTLAISECSPLPLIPDLY